MSFGIKIRVQNRIVFWGEKMNIEESIHALNDWSAAQQARRSDPSRPEGIIRLNQNGQLEFIAQPGFWRDKIKKIVGWGGWSPRRVLSFLQEHNAHIAQQDLTVVYEFAAHTFWKDPWGKTKVNAACLHILNQESLFLSSLAQGTGIRVPDSFSNWSVHVQAQFDSSVFEKIAAHNGYMRATVPENTTSEQRLFVEQYNRAIDGCLVSMRAQAFFRIEGRFTSPLEEYNYSFAVQDVVEKLRTERGPLMMTVLLEMLNKNTYTAVESNALCANIAGIWEQLSRQEKLKFIRSLGRNEVTSPPSELNETEKARFILALTKYCERQRRLGYGERLREELGDLQQALLNSADPLEQQIQKEMEKQLTFPPAKRKG